jgi:choline dehydrogenase-like flavoprotein
MARRLSADILVVGSGPGGAVAAFELQKAGRQVLIAEEGGSFKQLHFQPYSLAEMLSLYRHGGITTTFGNPAIKYIEGRCVGGGSEINSGMYHRTPTPVIEQWRETFQVDNFTEASLTPHFADCEKRVNVCNMPGDYPASSLKLLEGAKEFGWNCQEIPRWYKYSDKPNPSPVEGVRQSMSETYLPAFVDSGGEIISDLKIIGFKSNKSGWLAKGRHSDGSQVEIKASLVIVSAGAIQTPQLLRRSGITHNVGNSLKLHTSAKVIARFAEEINSELSGVPVHQVREFAPVMSFGCAVSSPAYLRLGLLDNPDFCEDINDVWRHMASYYVMISGGTGYIRSPPLLRDPLIWYRLNRDNLVNLALGLKRLSSLMFRAGADKVYPSINGFDGLSCEADIHKMPNILERSTASLMTIHLMGSCPMGEDRIKTAANSYGQIHDAPGLYVSDASLIGNELGVNPQGTVMALARRNAHHILQND